MTDINAQAGSVVGPVVVGPIAHGGHWVARHDGRVIFVRHALTGERVQVALTDIGHKKFWRGDAVDIREAAAERVTPRCPIAAACGGCDFQHVEPAAQRLLKAEVLAEQLERLAGMHWDGQVEEVPGGPWHWRTRMRYRTDATGRLAMRAHRSHDLVPLPDQGCAIAERQLDLTGWPPDSEVAVVGSTVLVNGAVVDGPPVLTEHAAGRQWQVAADGFWQVHPHAADTLVTAVLDAVQARPGETALDLYCGVGLFAGALAEQGLRVHGIESNRSTVRLAQRNVPAGRFVAGRVERAISRLPERADVVVLDPPRSGAGRTVVAEVARRRPRVIAYVACDPAALARDVGYFADHGYRLSGLRAFDLFPMTHHLEAVAQLVPVTPDEL